MHVNGLFAAAVVLAGAVSGKPCGHPPVSPTLPTATSTTTPSSLTSSTATTPTSSSASTSTVTSASQTLVSSISTSVVTTSSNISSSTNIPSPTGPSPPPGLPGLPGPPGPGGPGGPGSNLLEELTKKAMEKLRAKEKANPPKPGKCSLATANRRKDWNKMTKPERKNYIDAVKCMFTKSSTVSPDWAAGARVRYDDFAAIHINKTLGIHGTGNFLTWHRYHNWRYEQALREECGYKGANPYWNWFKYQDRLLESPLFDGSETSMGGNGAFFRHNGTLAAGLVYVPSGTGGGCVESGFLKDVTINLGPIRPAMDGMSKAVAGTMVYNPRCLRRDLNSFAAIKWHTYENLLDVVTGKHSGGVVQFQDEFQGRPADGFLGLHSGGHHTIGGDNSDNYSSIVDPVFMLHHSMVDYVYWLWQALNPDHAREVGGTIKARSEELGFTKRTDALDLGTVADPLTIDGALDTLDGPFCYIYE